MQVPVEEYRILATLCAIVRIPELGYLLIMEPMQITSMLALGVYQCIITS